METDVQIVCRLCADCMQTVQIMCSVCNVRPPVTGVRAGVTPAAGAGQSGASSGQQGGGGTLPLARAGLTYNDTDCSIVIMISDQ